MWQDNFQQFLNAPPALSFKAGEPSDHKRWREAVRQTVMRLLRLDRAEPLQIISTEARAQKSFWAEQFFFRSKSGQRLRGTILRPSREGRYPGVLVCPGRRAKLSHVTGAEPPDYPSRNVAEKLTAAGMTTLTLEYGLRGVLNIDSVGRRDEVNLVGLALGLLGESPLSFLVRNALSAVESLRDDPGVEPDKIALFGHSLGAHIAMCAGMALERETPVALASFLSPYANIFADMLTGDAAQLIPEILRYADLPDLVAALAPAPLQVQHGTQDTTLPAERTKPGLEVVRQSYDAVGASEALEILMLDMGHGTDINHLRRFLQARFDMPAREQVAVPAARIYFDGDTRREILDGIDKSLATGTLTLGPSGQQFETLARQWTKAPYSVAVSSGTAALEIALRAAGVEGRRVLIPANTFFATALSVLHAGAVLDFVEIEPVGLGMDPSTLEASLNEHADVAAVVVVHIGGVIAPSLRSILRVCEERGIPVIEDAAHALGSTLDGTYAGNIGLLGAFSMYPTKVATSGEGGFITAQLEEHALDAMARRDQGKQNFYSNVHDRIGNNWRMSELHASVGVATLKRLAGSLDERRELAAGYDRGLLGIPGVRPFLVPEGCSSNYYKYIALLDATVDREDLKRRLKAKHNVALAGEVYQLPCCAQPFFRGKYSEQHFPTAYDFCRRHICLPLFPTMTRAQQNAVLCALTVELGAETFHAV
jgi:dTDP-4-amino-4,6-dideoxygalactose transaminase/dienelactone hydrolase